MSHHPTWSEWEEMHLQAKLLSGDKYMGLPSQTKFIEFFIDNPRGWMHNRPHIFSEIDEELDKLCEEGKEYILYYGLIDKPTEL